MNPGWRGPNPCFTHYACELAGILKIHTLLTASEGEGKQTQNKSFLPLHLYIGCQKKVWSRLKVSFSTLRSGLRVCRLQIRQNKQTNKTSQWWHTFDPRTWEAERWISVTGDFSLSCPLPPASPHNHL